MDYRPTVWVLKEQVKSTTNGPVPMDYTAAYAYGNIRFITEMDLPLHPNSTVAKEWSKQVEKFMKEVNANDYVILTGQPLAMFLFGALCAVAEFIPNLLVWRREQSRYVVYDPTQIVGE